MIRSFFSLQRVLTRYNQLHLSHILIKTQIIQSLVTFWKQLQHLQ